MSKYRITLDGKTYEMEIELVEETTPSTNSVKREYKEFKSAPQDANINVVDPAVQKQTVSNTGAVAAPMPGTVIRIEKSEGMTVKAGELVLILEAMKMENEIIAPQDGVITKMNCEVGGTVASGEVMFEVK